MMNILDFDKQSELLYRNPNGRGHDYRYEYYDCCFGDFDRMTYEMKMRLFERGDDRGYKWYFSKDRQLGYYDTEDYLKTRIGFNHNVTAKKIDNDCADRESLFYDMCDQEEPSVDVECFSEVESGLEDRSVDVACIPRDEGSLIASRETHPFPTEVCLVGGGKRKNFKKKNKRPMRKNKKNKLREPPVFAHPQQHIDLSYTDNTIARNHATFTFLAFRFRLNGLYDPDPALGSGGISGFLEWSNLYRKYLVTKVRIKWDVTNLEAFPITICFCPSNYDINSLITDSSTALDMGEMTGGQVRQLSQAGGMDRNRIDTTVILSRFWGAGGEYLESSFFSGTGLANPTNMLFGQFAVASSNALVNGINSTLKFIYTVRWYSRQTPFDRTFKEVEVEQEIKDDLVVKNTDITIPNNDSQLRLQAELAVLKDRIDKLKI